MIQLLNKKTAAAVLSVALMGTMIVLPSSGADSEHEDVTLTGLEAAILNDNVAVKRAELALELADEEYEEAQDNKGSSGSGKIETGKNKKYYPVEAEINRYIARQNLEDAQQDEILSGTKLYYQYLLIVKEIGNKNSQILRLEDELAGVNKKIELGVATDNSRTSKELEIANAKYELLQLQDEKSTIFLDMNLALQQDLETVLVIEDIEIPYKEHREVDLDNDLEYIFATNKELRKLEVQDELDAILLEIYEDNNTRDAYDSNITELENTIDQNVIDIADKKLSLEYTLKSNYNDILNAADTVQIRELELENLQLTLETLTKRYEVGFETENAVKVAEEDVAAGELAVLQAKLDYYVSVETYENFLD